VWVCGWVCLCVGVCVCVCVCVCGALRNTGCVCGLSFQRGVGGLLIRYCRNINKYMGCPDNMNHGECALVCDCSVEHTLLRTWRQGAARSSPKRGCETSLSFPSYSLSRYSSVASTECWLPSCTHFIVVLKRCPIYQPY